MASRTKYIGTITTSTIILLLAWFVGSTNFDVEIDLNDKVCAGKKDPCEVSFNITATKFTYYLYNKEGVSLNFIPEVKESYLCKKDGRYRASWRADRSLAPCGQGFREFDFKSPLTSRYKYVEKFVKGKKHEYKLVVFKNPTDRIKWGGKLIGEEVDPIFLPTYEVIEKCETVTKTEYETCSEEIINYDNYTFINNITKLNESKQRIYTWNRTFDCKPKDIVYQINCRTIGLKTDEIKISCLTGYRCDVLNDDWCVLDCNDGDCNYNAKQFLEKGWSRSCIPISELKEGMELKPTSFKKTIVRVEKI